MDRPSSTKKILPFVEEFDIDTSTAQKQEFSSFNDFFTSIHPSPLHNCPWLNGTMLKGMNNQIINAQR